MSLSYTLRRRLAGAGVVICLIIGLAGWLFAVDEGRWVGRATTRPETLNLESVEQGNLPVNQFVSLRNHWAVYREHVATFRLTSKAQGGQRIETLYYPVISDMNPYLLELAGLSRAFGGLDAIPADEWPRIERMGALVRTDSVQSLDNVPPLIEFPDGLFGTVLHADTDLPGDERSLLTERWPDIDFSRVVIINAGHQPGNVWAMIAYGVVGVLGWSLALGLIWRLLRSPDHARHQSLAEHPAVSFTPPPGSAMPQRPLSAQDTSAGNRPAGAASTEHDSGERPLTYAEALNRYAPQHESASASRQPTLQYDEELSGIRPTRRD